MKQILYATLFLSLTLISCEKTVIPKETPINENIIKLPNSLFLNNALWINDSTIFYPTGYYTVTDDFNSIEDNIITRKSYNFIMQDYLDNKVLWISGNSLNEYNIITGELTTILESDIYISGAKYYRDTEHIIYHKYIPKEKYGDSILSGFYLYDRKTDTKELLLLDTISYLPDFFTNARGFDIHPIENKLLTLGFNKYLIEYSLDSQEIDTLNIFFRPPSDIVRYLWLRYNHSGSHLVYSYYYYNPYSSGESELGILDIQTSKKQILDANTNTRGSSVNIFPSWSPDDKHIVYGSGELDNKHYTKRTPKAPDPELFILKDINY